MKILFVIDSLRTGGKERRLVQLLKGLNKKKDFKAELIILNKDIYYKEVFHLNIPVQYLKRNILQDIKLIPKFIRICNDFKPDIVHCWYNIATLHFAPICKLLKIKVINSSISAAPISMSFFSKRYLITALTYPYSDIILSNSRTGLKSFRVPKRKGEFIYNGFDFDRLGKIKSKNEIKKKMGIQTKYVIGMVASFTNFKDYGTFINVAKQLVRQQNITFIGIGDGKNHNQLLSTLCEKEKKYIKMPGKRNDVESIINTFDIGVLLSTNGEGISNSIMEYMALCKPVIATKGGGTSELVINNETGFLIEPKKPEQLADKIEYLISNRDFAKKMGQKGKERIKKYFTSDKMVDKTYELYKVVLSG